MFRLTLGKFCIEDLQILGAIVWNLVTMAIWCPGFLHHKFSIELEFMYEGDLDKSLA